MWYFCYDYRDNLVLKIYRVCNHQSKVWIYQHPFLILSTAVSWFLWSLLQSSWISLLLSNLYQPHSNSPSSYLFFTKPITQVRYGSMNRIRFNQTLFFSSFHLFPCLISSFIRVLNLVLLKRILGIDFLFKVICFEFCLECYNSLCSFNLMWYTVVVLSWVGCGCGVKM